MIKLGMWWPGDKGGWKERRRGEVEREKELEGMEWLNQGKTESESQETDVLIKRTIMSLPRNLVLEEFPQSHKDNPS